MKVDRKHFCEILDTVKFGLSKSKSLESMLYFQFTGDDLIAYNNHILVKHKFKSEFVGFVHANNMIRTMSKLTSKEVDISIDSDKFLIKTGKVKMKLALLIDEEIKDRTDVIVKEIKECEWYKIPKNFIESLKLCHFVISKNESHNTLQYAYVKGTTMTASDNNRVAQTELSKKMKTMLLKHDIISILVDLGIKEYGITKSQLHFKGENDDFILSFRKIVGKYPDFSEILKTAKKGIKITLSSDIANDLDISEIFKTEFDSSVSIKIKDNYCYITANSEAGNMSTKSKIEYSGKELKFNINPVFLNEMLNHSATITHGEGGLSLESNNFLLVTALMEKD